MEIKITKSNIYDYALALTARSGTSTDAYNQIAITKDNYPMLDVYLSEAIVQAESVLRKKLSGSTTIDMSISGDTAIIQTEEQYMADTALYPLIESSIRLYAAYHIAASWLQASAASSLSEVFGATAATHLQTAVSALAQKEMTKVNESEYGTRSTDQAVMNEQHVQEYGTRSTDQAVMNEQHVQEYGTRSADQAVMNEQHVQEYGTRSADNVIVRPGVRMTENEVLVLCADDDGGSEPAIGPKGEYLISNQ